MNLVTAAQMRQLEERAEAAGISIHQLMENAGLATAQEGWMLLGTLADRVVLVLVGPGNNGGDGLVAARHLSDWGAETRVYLTRARTQDDNLLQLEQRGLQVLNADSDPDLSLLDQSLSASHLVIDALLGTGQARPIEGTIGSILNRLAAVRAKPLAPKLLAVDLPTGLNSDTGAVDPHTVTPDETVTFGVPKIGLYCLPGSSHSGRIETVDIGIPQEATADLPLSLLTSARTRDHLPARPLDANKGTFGKLLTIVGSANYVGAAFLSSASGYRIGAGLVTIGLPRSIQGMVAQLVPEATFLPLGEDEGGLVGEDLPMIRQTIEGYNALLIGCGLGQRAYTQQLVRSLLYGLDRNAHYGVVVDADGLNSLAEREDWWQRFRARAVLTPHPGEFARLARMPVATVQADRVGVALHFAQEWNKIVVLKGAHTVIATPDGKAVLSPFANAALATAGTGDVLAGAIAGLLAQGVEPADAAAAGVYLHAAAGELLARDFGEAGGLAGDLVLLLPEARREILSVR
jgi:NAD(P)H-hydrate epimerase